MVFRSIGKRKASLWSADSPQTYYYESPGCDFECEKILGDPKKLAAMSGPVNIIKLDHK